MAYRNPETNRIYLMMKNAPICDLQDGVSFTVCPTCPITKVAKKHPAPIGTRYSCADICTMFQDEVADACGYEKVIVEA